MKIIRDGKSATLTLVPVGVVEEQTITSIIELLKPEDKLYYEGRDQDPDNKKFFTVRFHIGESREMYRRAMRGSISVTDYVYLNCLQLILCGGTEDDKYEIQEILNMCVFGSGSLIFTGVTEVDGKQAIIVIGSRCKHCNSGMIDLHSCKWETCDTCAAKCEHRYVSYDNYYMRIRIPGDEGVSEFQLCNKCGRHDTSNELIEK